MTETLPRSMPGSAIKAISRDWRRRVTSRFLARPRTTAKTDALLVVGRVAMPVTYDGSAPRTMSAIDPLQPEPPVRSSIVRGTLLALASALSFGLATPWIDRAGAGLGPFTIAAL